MNENWRIIYTDEREFHALTAGRTSGKSTGNNPRARSTVLAFDEQIVKQLCPWPKTRRESLWNHISAPKFQFPCGATLRKQRAIAVFRPIISALRSCDILHSLPARCHKYAFRSAARSTSRLGQPSCLNKCLFYWTHGINASHFFLSCWHRQSVIFLGCSQ